MKNFQLLIFAFLVLGSWFLVDLVNSQTTPEFLITWKASSYIPSEYQGKVLPTAGSTINIAFDLISGNKIADLSKNKIQWTANKKLIGSGLGLKNLNVGLDKLSNTNLNLTIKTIYKGVELEKFIVIPITEPEVVIKTINQNTLMANPYFFNIPNLNQLSFDWIFDGQKPVGKPKLPNVLEIEGANLIPAGLSGKNQINIETTVINSENQLERAVGKLFIKI